jgi:hypothetical protein
MQALQTRHFVFGDGKKSLKNTRSQRGQKTTQRVNLITAESLPT